jgi:hypothetical protein
VGNVLTVNAGLIINSAKRTEVTMNKYFYLLFILIIPLLISSCDYSNKPARGPEDEIYVVADSAEFLELQYALDSTFQKTIFTPQPENLFNLVRVSPNQLEKYKRRKNLIIIAPLNSTSVTSQFIKSVTDSVIINKFKSEEDFTLVKYDLWAKDQIVMILSAPTMQALEFKILKEKDNLLYSFQKISDQRLYKSLYNSQYEQKEVEGHFLKNYGWIIYVQADFKVAMEKPEDNFVWLRRSPGSDMERWLFVHWIDNATPAYLNEDSIKAVRNRLTQKYYQTSDDSGFVVLVENYFTLNEVNFKGRYALMIQGLWDLNIKGMGGPFISYTFFDEKTKRIYMIDGSVYAPKYYKRNLIHQMDVTLQSFMTEAEVPKDRLDDLLEEAENYSIIK